MYQGYSIENISNLSFSLLLQATTHLSSPVRLGMPSLASYFLVFPPQICVYWPPAQTRPTRFVLSLLLRHPLRRAEKARQISVKISNIEIQTIPFLKQGVRDINVQREREKTINNKAMHKSTYRTVVRANNFFHRVLAKKEQIKRECPGRCRNGAHIHVCVQETHGYGDIGSCCEKESAYKHFARVCDSQRQIAIE